MMFLLTEKCKEKKCDLKLDFLHDEERFLLIVVDENGSYVYEEFGKELHVLTKEAVEKLEEL